MAAKFYISFLFVLFFTKANCQIVLDRDEEKEVLYIYENQDDKMLLRDSIVILNIFSEYSYVENNRLIYLVWSAMSEYGKVYYINTYSLGSDGKINLGGQYWIEEEKHKRLFKKGLSVTVCNKGIQLSFKQGKIALVVLSFDDLDLKKLSKALSKVERLLSS